MIVANKHAQAGAKQAKKLTVRLQMSFNPSQAEVVMLREKMKEQSRMGAL